MYREVDIPSSIVIPAPKPVYVVFDPTGRGVFRTSCLQGVSNSADAHACLNIGVKFTVININGGDVVLTSIVRN